MNFKAWFRVCLFTLMITSLVALVQVEPAHADVSPPERPPGSNPVPGEEGTQVQMIEELVVLEVQGSPWPGEPISNLVRDWARVTATFVMLNQGPVEESMQVRFPLADLRGTGDGRGEFPEIEDLQVWVDGSWVPTTRVTSPVPDPIFADNPPLAWSGFDVTFPPGEQVEIKVRYSHRATGYHPQSDFRYILETGAGWKGPIGSAELVVRLPYLATPENLLVDYSTDGVRFEGREARWTFRDLEPTHGDNLIVRIIEPGFWFAVLDAQQAVEADPDDGDAWGVLARAYKRVLLGPRNWMREDEAAEGLFQVSAAAYVRAIELLPDVAKWHAGYAELLWLNIWLSGDYANPELTLIAQQLGEALKLEPENEQAWEVLTEMSYFVPLAVEADDSTYDLLILTATVQPSPTPPPTATETPPVIPTRRPTATEPVPVSAVEDRDVAPEDDGSGSGSGCLGGTAAMLVGPLLIAGIVRTAARQSLPPNTTPPRRRS